MKPMLAASICGEPIYPLLVSPKLDGIRALVVNGQIVSRTLKPIPNWLVQELFGRAELNGLDGELVVGPPTASDVFQRTTSGVMSRDGEPEVRFHVFDDFTHPQDPFEKRLARAQKRCEKLQIDFLKHHEITSTKALLEQEARYLALGFEGLMARDPEGPYKFGRSTAKQGWLLKLKRFHDSEAEVVGVKELLHNNNTATVNALGYQERSNHKDGKAGASMVGALTVRDCETGVEFDIGTGFTIHQRKIFWRDRKEIVGKIVKYKSQLVGVKEKPRFPVFLGFRDLQDLTERMRT